MHSRALLSCACVLLTPLVASAQAVPSQRGATVKEERPGLLARAVVGPDSATKIAMARVPGGRVTEAEIEIEHGKLVYSFDLAVPGRSGVEEVLVDARTGTVVSVEHEDDAVGRAEPPADSTKPPARRSPRRTH
jgi:hypothetical protein